MASLKIPLQVNCSNCAASNLPGSPHCNSCGAPIAGVPQAQQQQEERPITGGLTTQASGSLQKFVADGQDPALVKQVYEKTLQVLTGGEEIEYVAVANKAAVASTPDSAVSTNKRLIVYRKKRFGKLEADDIFWRDVRNIEMKDDRMGASLACESVQGWRLKVEALPSDQARHIYDLGMQYSDRVRSSLGQQMAAAASVAPPTVADTSQQAGVSQPLVLSAEQVHEQTQPAYYAEIGQPPTRQPQAGPNYVPTPQSVLQDILNALPHQDVNGQSASAMQAAAFQAPQYEPTSPLMAEQIAHQGNEYAPGQRPTGPLLPSRLVTGKNGGTLIVGQADPNAPFQVRGANPSGPLPVMNSGNPNSNGPFYAQTVQPDPVSYVEQPLNEANSGMLRPDMPNRSNYGSPFGDADNQSGPLRAAKPKAPVPSSIAKPPVQSAKSASGAQDDLVRKMKQLKEMLDIGLITPEEFEAKKADILERI